MVRTPCIDKNGLRKGAWSAEEDNKLRAHIERYGHWNWRELPKFAGLSRCGKSCRLRWMNYLRPNVKRGNYTKEEDNTIIKLRQELGNKWSVIAAKLSGRTDNEIKNHWHTHLKKLGKQNHISSDDQEQESTVFEENHEDQSCGTSQFEADQKIDFTPENHVVEIVPPISQQASSKLFPLSFDYALLSDIHWDAESTLHTSFESFEEPIGDFWGEPFSADTSCNLNDVSTSSLVGGGFSSSYFIYDDCTDLFYELMQDFSNN